VEGVLYVAIGERCLESSILSARSVRAAMPSIKLAVASDLRPPSLFDKVLTLEERDGHRAKPLAMLRTPFSRTLFLDADTYVATDVTDAFQLLDRFDLAAAHAPNRVSLPLEGVPEAFPEFNTGVLAFRNNRRVRALLRQWMKEYDRLPSDRPVKDQPAFRRAVYHARRVRVATLPPELNLRFLMGGYHNQEVRILHAWADQETYQHAAQLLNGRVTTWHHSAVFVGGKLFGPSGEVVGDLQATASRAGLATDNAGDSR
jgi:hypothetical protein